MATIHDVSVALLDMVQSAVGPAMIVVDQRVEIKAAIGWPQENVLQDLAKKQHHEAVIAIYDRRISKNSTRWMPSTLDRTVSPTGITSTLSDSVLQGEGEITITIGGNVLSNDAVSFVVNGVSRETDGVVYVTAPGDTLENVASGLAGAINGSAALQELLTAHTAGNVVTVSSQIPDPLNLISACGNIASELRELGRRNRQFQIACWTRTQEERLAITNPIESQIAINEADFGLCFSDGTVGRLLYVNDHDIDDDTLQDVLRRDFFVSVDYAITNRDVLYAVLAPIPRFTVV